MVQADPIITEIYNPQNWNPYSYVLNNPLNLTDPSGYSFLSKYWRTIAAIVVTVYTGGLAAGAATSWAAAGWSIGGGFVAGAIQTNSLRGGIYGAFSAGVFSGIGTAFGRMAQAGTYSANALRVGKVVAHGMAGGVMSSLQGGKFGHGFASAGFSEAASPIVASRGGPISQGTAAAVIGGTASAMTGGKFANGAVTAAFGYAFNHLAHSANESGKTLLERINEKLTKIMRGTVSWPTDHSTVTSSFDPERVHPVTGATRPHNGTDIRARLGDSIYATQVGTVTEISLSQRGGNQIIIRNLDGSISGYAHVGAVDGISIGSQVTSGQLIATSDGSGVGTAPHLHYTYRPGTVFHPATMSTSTVNAITNQLHYTARPDLP